MSRKYYAIEWNYGRAVNSDGSRAGSVREFASKAERDAWCEDGPAYTTDAGFREMLTAKDVKVDSYGKLVAR